MAQISSLSFHHVYALHIDVAALRLQSALLKRPALCIRTRLKDMDCRDCSSTTIQFRVWDLKVIDGTHLPLFTDLHSMHQNKSDRLERERLIINFCSQNRKLENYARHRAHNTSLILLTHFCSIGFIANAMKGTDSEYAGFIYSAPDPDSNQTHKHVHLHASIFT
jgi:hypothetical protein